MKKSYEDWAGHVALLFLLQALIIPYQELGRRGPNWLEAPRSWRREQNARQLADRLYPQGVLEARVLTESWLNPAASTLNARASPRQYEPAWDVPTSSAAPLREDLSLEEADMIDILWRSDIDMEKGRMPTVPEQQHERVRNTAIIREDLSLEEADMIDILWRSDIDMEKGRMPTVPEQQHERVRNTAIIREDLSLEEADMIDILWRSDIDMEKGRMPTVPEQQHERDMDLLTQKHLSDHFYLPQWATNENDAGWANGVHKHNAFQSQPTAQYEAVKDWESSWGVGMEEGAKASSIELEEETKGAVEAEKDWLDWLGPDERVVQEDACQAAAGLEAFLSTLADPAAPAGGDDVLLSAAATSMDESLDFFGSDPLSIPDLELESIPTPSLDLSPLEVGQLFADHQVVSDVAESVSALSPTGDRMATAMGNPGQLRGAVGGGQRTRRQRNAFSASGVSDTGSDGSTWVEGTASLPEYSPERKEQLPASSGAAVSPRFVSPPLSVTPTPSLLQDHDYVNIASPLSPSTSGGDREEGKLRPPRPFDPEAQPMKEEPEEGEDEEEEIDVMQPTTTQQRRTAGRRSEDEALCAAHSIPYSPAQIVDMPLVEFQALLRSRDLSSSQVDVVKKIRRRGKNKLAARNCRKRKNTNLEQLDTETSLLDQEREVETRVNVQLKKDIAEAKAEIAQLEKELSSLGS